MIEYRKVFLDTTPIIYFLDQDANFGNKVENILLEILEGGKEMLTSTITCMEYLTYPYKTGNIEKVNAFFDFVSDCDIAVYCTLRHKAVYPVHFHILLLNRYIES